MVASMGTSLTAKQCDILSAYQPCLYLLTRLRGSTMTPGLDLLKQSGLEVKVVERPKTS